MTTLRLRLAHLRKSFSVRVTSYTVAGALPASIAFLASEFVHHGSPLARVQASGIADDALRERSATAVRSAVVVGEGRTFDQDPRFGLVVLSEVALRALPPSVNDSGTVIDVVGRHARLLTEWALGHDEASQVELAYPRVRVPALRHDDLFEVAFAGVAHHGSGHLGVVLRLTKSLDALTHVGPDEFRAAARHHLDVAVSRAREALPHPEDQRRLAEAVGRGV